MPTSVCQWITNFLTDRQQLVRLGKYTSSTHTISTQAPQGCVLSPLLFCLYNNCTSKDPSVKLLKFAYDTTMIDLIQDSDESARVLQEKPPCSPPTHHHEQHCDCSGVIQVPGHHHLPGPEVGQSHRLHCEKAQLRKFNLPQELLKQFYSAIIESALWTSATLWFSSATKSDLKRLRRVVRTAEQIIGTTLPSLQELYLSRVSKRAGKITLDPSHPAHSLFELLPSVRRYRALSTRTTRHRNSFFPQAIHLMNYWQ